jgi:hypothetical protein
MSWGICAIALPDASPSTNPKLAIPLTIVVFFTIEESSYPSVPKIEPEITPSRKPNPTSVPKNVIALSILFPPVFVH